MLSPPKTHDLCFFAQTVWLSTLPHTNGLRHSHFETRLLNAIELPGPRQQQHNNQTMCERVGAQVARGDCMGSRSDLLFLHVVIAKKRVVWGWLQWFRTMRLALE